MQHAERIDRLESLVERLIERVERLEGREAPQERSAAGEAASWPVRVREAVSEATDEAPRRARAQVPPPSPKPRPARAPRPRGGVGEVEQTVGARVFAIAGALIVIAAAALFLKLAWDRGWLELVPDIYKVGASVAFGALLLGAGEWARRRINVQAAAGLSAAGVGVLYATAYAAHALFHLVGPAGGFAALIAAVAIGVVVSAQSRLAVVAVISLVGGYGAPFLLGSPESHPATLPVYWLSLLVVGLTLSAWRAGWFTTLRVLVWWGTVVFGLVWTNAQGAAHPHIALGFLGAAWALVHAELLVAARAERLSDEALWTKAFEPGETWRIFRPFGSSLTISAWGAALAAVVLDQAYALDWLAPAGGFAVTALLAIPLIGHLRVLRDRPETDLERLGVVFAVEAGALLFATIALGLAGWMAAAAWLGLGVASLVAGRWIRSRGFDVYGVLVLIVATLRVLSLGWWVQTPLTTVAPFGVVVTEGGVLALVAGGAWIGAAVIVRRGERGAWSAMNAGLAVGLLLVCLSLTHRDADARTLRIVYLALSIWVYHARRLAGWLHLDRMAMIPLGMATLAMLTAYPLHAWLERSDAIAMHPGLWLALVIALAGALMGAGLLRRNRFLSEGHSIGAFAAGGAALLAFVVTSFEVTRSASLVIADETSQRAAVSMWWGVLGVACIGAGFWRKAPIVRHTGMGLLALATMKAVLFDLAFVSAEWRVVSFLVLGLLLLGVGVVYARVSARVGAREAEYTEAEE